MLALGSIQTTVSAAIAARAYMSQAPAVSCIVDDGIQDSAIEAQLRTRGSVVVVPPIVRAARRDIGAGKLAMDAEVVVRILLNPTANAATGGANRNIYTLISEATSAVLGWVPATPGDRRFETSDEFLQLLTNDPGLIAYELSFAKLSTLN